MFTQRSNSITGELKRIFTSTNYSEFNSVRDAHQSGDKAKKTKKKAKGKRKKHNLPDYLRHNDETVTYKCEMNESPRRARKESLRYEPKRISPSTYYLSAGDSIERELCKDCMVPREPKAIDESCDCVIPETTSPKASKDRDSLARRDNRKYSQDCTMRRADQGKSDDATRHIRKKCNCTCGIPEHPTSTTCQTVQNIDIQVDGQTSPVSPGSHTAMGKTATSILYKNASCECPSLNKNNNITLRTIEKKTQPSKMITPKMLPTVNTYAGIGYKSRELPDEFSKNVTYKCLSLNTNFSHQGKQFYCSSCECVPVGGNLPDQRHRNASSECPSPKKTFKRLAIPAIMSLTGTTKHPVNVQTDCPVPSNPSQGSNIPSFGSLFKAGYYKARTAITGTDAPLTSPVTIPNYSVQTGAAPAFGKLSHTVACSVDDETDCHPLRQSPLPKCISCNTSDWCYYKIPRTTQCEAPLPSPYDCPFCSRPRCKVSCGSLPVKRIIDVASSPTTVNGERVDIKPSCPRMRRKPPPRRTKLKNKFNPFFKKKKSVTKTDNYVDTHVCIPPKIQVDKINSCIDAETGCLNDSCRAGPRRVYTLFPPVFTRSTCYFYYIIYVVAMIVCSPLVAIIFFCRFVTSPIRPSGYDCGEICPPCIPPRPCPHVLIRLFKCRQMFDTPTVCSNGQRTTGRVCNRQKRPSVSKKKTKRQREIKQHSTSCSAKACKNGTKTPQIVTDCSVILSKCSMISRPREDEKLPRLGYKPTSCEDQMIPSIITKPLCEYQTIPSKQFKPTTCDYQIKPRKYSKVSSPEHEIILSKYSKGSSREYEIIPSKSSKASSCGHGIKPSKY